MGETIVDNNVNDATHVDLHILQHWAHCTQSVVASFDVFTSHSTQLKPFALVFHVPWVFSLHRSLLPALPLLPPFPHDWRWFRDSQHPVQLRQRDLRHPGRLSPQHRLWAQRHGVHRHHGAWWRDLLHSPFVRPLHGRRRALLAEEHRDYADYRRAEGVSVSPSSVSVMVDRTGEPVERCDGDHFGLCQKREKCSKSVSWNHSSWKNGRSNGGTCGRDNCWGAWKGFCWMSSEKRLSQSIARKFLITNSLQLKQNMNAESYRENCCDNNRIFVKFINKILQRWRNCKNSKIPRDYDAINGESTEFDWNIFPGFTTLQLCDKISNLLSSLGQTPETFTGRILFMSMFNDIFCDRYDNKDECLRNANIVQKFAGDLVLVNGHWLDQVLRIVHKEPGTILRKRCCCNSQNADIPFSVQRLHCPGFSWKAKDVENCLNTSPPIKMQLMQFIALFFLSISSVSTEQWQPYARNLKTIKIERDNLWYWWDSQLFLTKLKQKLLFTMKIPEMTKLFGSNTFNKLNRFHQKVKWVDSVRKQDLCVLLKLDNISWPRTLVILDKFVQWLVTNTLFHETTKLLNQNGGSKEIWELDLYWKSRSVFSTSSTELKLESSQWTKTILIPGSEFPMERSNVWSILLKTTQKILQIHKKRKVYQQAQEWLQPGQRWKQNHNRGYLLGRQQPYQYTKEDGLKLNHQNKILLRTISRRKSSIFFDTIKRYSEKKMEQLNSTK